MFSVPMQHSQTERLKTLNQSEPAIKIPGCSGAFTYITAQIVKERSVLTNFKRQKAADEFSSADFWPRSWWSQPGSNRRPLACKASALPAELWPLACLLILVGLGGFEPPTPRLSSVCSNQLSYRPGRNGALCLYTSVLLV